MKIIIGYWGIVDDALNLGKYVVPPKNYCHNACMVSIIIVIHVRMTFSTSRYTRMTNMVMSVSKT